ncbi:MAG: hypothetical protein ABI806_00940 [Candidatus Solibacter sp.]
MDRDGFLLRCSERQAMEQLLAEIMIRSPHGKWAGSAHFGLRDFLEDAGSRPERLQMAVEELNLTFADLGMTIRAKTITLTPGATPGTVGVEISLIPAGVGEEPFQLRVEA